MGKFANSAAEMGEPAYSFGPIERGGEWHGESEFEALGKVVPNFRRSAANEHLKAMGFTDAEQRFNIVQTMSGKVAADDPHMALEEALKLGVDATGCYRILSVLLTAEQPA